MDTTPFTDRALFRHWAHDICRYADTDRQGHINNATFATFCETGRVSFVRADDRELSGDGREFVIVRLTLDFRAELQWGQAVEIGTGVRRIGRTSFTLGQGVFHGARCVATAESTLVLLDSATRRPAPVDGALRERLEAHLVPETA